MSVKCLAQCLAHGKGLSHVTFLSLSPSPVIMPLCSGLVCTHRAEQFENLLASLAAGVLFSDFPEEPWSPSSAQVSAVLGRLQGPRAPTPSSGKVWARELGPWHSEETEGCLGPSPPSRTFCLPRGLLSSFFSNK